MNTKREMLKKIYEEQVKTLKDLLKDKKEIEDKIYKQQQKILDTMVKIGKCREDTKEEEKEIEEKTE